MPQNLPIDPKTGQPLDASVVTLARAIRATESNNNYSAIGDKGKSKGAYQFNGSNYENWAKQYGVDPNDFSPQAQDKVAYYKLLEHKQQGYTPEQVASIWNSGGPDYQGKVGVNKDGVKYDVPKYVNSVIGKYQQFKQGVENGQTLPNPSNPAQQQTQNQVQSSGEAPQEGYSVGGFAKNVAKSAGGLLSGLGQLVTHPIDAAKNLGGATVGAGQLLIPGEQGQEDKARAIGQFYKERYGGADKIGNTLYNDPVGAALDVSTLLGTGGGLLKTAGRVALPGELATQLTRAGELAANAGKVVDPLRAAGKLASVAVSPITSRLSSASEKLLATELKLNPSDVNKISKANVAGISPYQWLKDNGIFGSRSEIIDQLETMGKKSRSTVDSALAGVQKTYDIYGDTRVTPVLEDIRATFGSIPGNEDLLGKIDGLLSKAKDGKFTLTDFNETKRLMDSVSNIYNRSGDIASGAKARGLANVRDQIKTFIENEAKDNGVPNIKELNKTTQVAKGIRDAALKKELGSEANRIIGLTDMLALMGGGATFGLDGGAGAYVLKKALESSTVKMFVARRLARFGPKVLDTLEAGVKSGNPPPVLKSIMNDAVNFAKTNPAAIAELGVQNKAIGNLP